MEKIKTLANCTDIEGLRQTNRIRHAVQDWMEIIKFAEKRKVKPDLVSIPENADSETREQLEKENRERALKQGRANMSAILDAMLEEYPEETAKIIRLCCFVDPDDNTKPILYYLAAFTEMFSDEVVVNFFMSLVNMVKVFGLTP